MMTKNFALNREEKSNYERRSKQRENNELTYR
jgi:hypothetical protein